MITNNNQSKYIPGLSEKIFILEKMKERVKNLNPEIDTEWINILEKELGKSKLLIWNFYFQLVYSHSEDRFIVKSKYPDNYNSWVQKEEVAENNKYYCKLFDDVIVDSKVPYYVVFEWRQLEFFTSNIKLSEMYIKDDLLKVPSEKELERLDLTDFRFSGVELQKADSYTKQEILRVLKEQIEEQIRAIFSLNENNFQTHRFVYYLITSYDFSFLSETNRERLTDFIIRICLEIMTGREVYSGSLQKLLDTNLLSVDLIYLLLQQKVFEKLIYNEDFLINKITRDLKEKFLTGEILDEGIKMIMNTIFHKTSFFEKINLLSLIDKEVLSLLKENNLVDTSKSKSLKLLLWLSK